MTFTVFTYITTILVVLVVMLLVLKWMDIIRYWNNYSPGFLLLLLIMPLFRLLFPFEYPFAVVIRSKTIYPWLMSVFRANVHIASIQVSLPNIAGLLWVTGVFCLMVKGVKKYSELVNCFKLMKSTGDEQINRIFNEEVKAYRTEKDFRIIKTPCVSEPLVYGLRHPTILLPDIELSDNEMQYVLNHELYHYIKGHIRLKWFLEFVCVLHWWFPPVFWIKKQIYNIMEIQADRCILITKTNADRVGYLKTLLKVCEYKQGNITGYEPLFTSNYTYGDSKAMQRRFLAVKNMSRNNEKRARRTGRVISVVLGLLILLSYSFVLQPYGLPPDPDVFSLNAEEHYLVENENGTYELYNASGHVGTILSYSDDIQHLSIKHTNRRG